MLADLVVPDECAGCSAAPGPLCAGCRSQLSRPAVPAWPRPCPPGLPPPYAAAPYDGPIRAALLAHKEHGRLSLSRPLGEALAMSASALPASGEGTSAGAPLVLVPVPSSAAALRRRGYDPTGRIVRSAAAVLRARGQAATCLPVLRQRRAPEDQAGLTAEQRMANLNGALHVPPQWLRLVAGRRVILADDVLTTGATLAESARAIAAAGGHVAGCALVAATRRRNVAQEPWANRIIPYPEPPGRG